MAYTSLYRKYRPSTFDEVIGQDTVVRILRNMVSAGSIAHAYLFTGTRGTGKISAENCLHGARQFVEQAGKFPLLVMRC